MNPNPVVQTQDEEPLTMEMIAAANRDYQTTPDNYPVVERLVRKMVDSGVSVKEMNKIANNPVLNKPENAAVAAAAGGGLTALLTANWAAKNGIQLDNPPAYDSAKPLWDNLKAGLSHFAGPPGTARGVANQAYFDNLVRGSGIEGATRAYNSVFNEYVKGSVEQQKSSDTLMRTALIEQMKGESKDREAARLSSTLTTGIVNKLTDQNIGGDELKAIGEQVQQIFAASNMPNGQAIAYGNARQLLETLSQRGVDGKVVASIAQSFDRLVKPSGEDEKQYAKFRENGISEQTLMRIKWGLPRTDRDLREIERVDRVARERAVAGEREMKAAGVVGQAAGAITTIPGTNVTPQVVTAQGEGLKSAAALPENMIQGPGGVFQPRTVAPAQPMPVTEGAPTATMPAAPTATAPVAPAAPAGASLADIRSQREATKELQQTPNRVVDPNVSTTFTAPAQVSVAQAKDNIKANSDLETKITDAASKALTANTTISSIQSTIDKMPKLWGIISDNKWLTTYVNTSNTEEKQRQRTELATKLGLSNTEREYFDRVINEYSQLYLNAVQSVSASQANSNVEGQRIQNTVGSISDKASAAMATLERVKLGNEYTALKQAEFAKAKAKYGGSQGFSASDFNSWFDGPDGPGAKLLREGADRIEQRFAQTQRQSRNPRPVTPAASGERPPLDSFRR